MDFDTKWVMQVQHRELVEELFALETPEERLSWLMERTPLHAPLSDDERDPTRKVPGCLSGLWLKAEVRDDRCFFASHSDSDLVQGVTSFVCDLYSGRTAGEIIELGASLAQRLKLDGLLSTTRKRALSNTVAFVLASASNRISAEPAKLESAA